MRCSSRVSLSDWPWEGLSKSWSLACWRNCLSLWARSNKRVLVQPQPRFKQWLLLGFGRVCCCRWKCCLLTGLHAFSHAYPNIYADAFTWFRSRNSLDTCVRWWVELPLKNTGSTSFKSMSITVRDRDTGVVLANFTYCVQITVRAVSV